MRCDRVQFFLIRFLCQEPAGSLWAPGSHFPADGPSGPEGGGWGGDPGLWLALLCLQKQHLATLPWTP